jgi:hypothetical protein
MWVIAGRISLATSLITQVSMKSTPVDLEFLSPLIILATSPGDTE